MEGDRVNIDFIGYVVVTLLRQVILRSRASLWWLEAMLMLKAS